MSKNFAMGLKAKTTINMNIVIHWMFAGFLHSVNV